MASELEQQDIFRLIEQERALVGQLLKKYPDENVVLAKQDELFQRIAEYAIKDPMTHLLNRNAYDAIISGLVEKGKQDNMDFAHCILDIDHFKRINDTLGHERGDEVLRETAQRILEDTKTPASYMGPHAVILRGEHPVRFGGEELVLIYPDCTMDDAYARVETLRQHIQGRLACRFSDMWPITLSAGVASLDEAARVLHIAQIPPSFERLRKVVYVLSDAALYVAKEEGRNRTRRVDEIPASHAADKVRDILKDLFESVRTAYNK